MGYATVQAIIICLISFLVSKRKNCIHVYIVRPCSCTYHTICALICVYQLHPIDICPLYNIMMGIIIQCRPTSESIHPYFGLHGWVPKDTVCHLDINFDRNLQSDLFIQKFPIMMLYKGQISFGMQLKHTDQCACSMASQKTHKMYTSVYTRTCRAYL